MIDLIKYREVMDKIARENKVDRGVGFSMFMANVKAGVDSYKCEDKIDYKSLKTKFDKMTEEEKREMYDKYFDLV